MQLEVQHSKTPEGPLAMEAALHYSLMIGNGYGPLYMWLMDPLKYGVGIIGYFWREEEISTVYFL